MKKILVPIDFSTTADNAVHHAIQIAAAFGSVLYLYHVYSFDRFNYNLDFSDEEQPYTKEIERKMKLTIFKFKDQIDHHGLEVRTIAERDTFTALFEEKVKKHQIDLIIMGSNGAAGVSKILFGSTAAAALATAKVPLLVIPPDAIFRPIEHIVLAVDGEKVAKNLLEPLRKIALAFQSNLTVLQVNTNAEHQVDNTVQLSLEGVKTTQSEVPLAKSINDSINNFIQNRPSDLLCMIRREKGFWERVFNISVTKTQVFSTLIPLLVLPEKS